MHHQFQWLIYFSYVWILDFGTLNIGARPELRKVMGHASTETTQKSYGRIQAATAAEEVRSLLDQPAIVPRIRHTAGKPAGFLFFGMSLESAP